MEGYAGIQGNDYVAAPPGESERLPTPREYRVMAERPIDIDGGDLGGGPPDEGGCSFVDEPFFNEELSAWSLDTCPQVLCGFVNRPEEHVFAQDAGVAAGDSSPATLHGARAELDRAENDEEPCKRHYGRTTLTPEGDVRHFMCTDYGDNDGPETHELLPFVRFEGDNTNGVVEQGDMAMLTTLRAPNWHEVIFLSHAKRCRGQDI